MSPNIRTIGIIGAGQMGGGIAHVSALAGYKVSIYDVLSERIEERISAIGANMTRQVSSGKLDEKIRDDALSRISSASTMADLGSADLVIEAATEDESIKRKIFAQICPHLNPDTILATNTSSISITRLATQTDRPERFIGIHFMNPVPVMKLVELVRGIATDERTFEKAKAFVKQLDKSITVSEDFPAFIVNRILLPMINEAIYTLYEGVGSVEAMGSLLAVREMSPAVSGVKVTVVGTQEASLGVGSQTVSCNTAKVAVLFGVACPASRLDGGRSGRSMRHFLDQVRAFARLAYAEADFHHFFGDLRHFQLEHKRGAWQIQRRAQIGMQLSERPDDRTARR